MTNILFRVIVVVVVDSDGKHGCCCCCCRTLLVLYPVELHRCATTSSSDRISPFRHDEPRTTTFVFDRAQQYNHKNYDSYSYTTAMIMMIEIVQ